MNNLQKIYKKIFKTGLVALLIGLFFWTAIPQSDAAYAGTWQFPLKGPWDVSFGFGATYAGKYHLAEDMLDPAGTPVYAPANGTIVRIENWPSCQNYGGLVLMEVTNYDGSKVVALMGHIIGATIAVSEGQTVSRGQVIGYLGNYSQNGCWEEHIHFGINKGAYQETPWKYWGYGDADMLKEWEQPSTYVNARSKFVEVGRVPANSLDRYQTAVGVSQREFPVAGSADNVLLASGMIHVDGLAAAPLTQTLNAPLLLTKKNKLPESSVTEIKRVLKSDGRVYILGGGAAINSAVEKQIQAMGHPTKRIAGANREATATTAAGYLKTADTVFITHRTTFADSISAGGPATTYQDPILLTKSDQLSQPTADYLAHNKQIKNVVIVGGTSSITSTVPAQIRDLRSDLVVSRTWGHDRYATNISLNQRYIKNPEKIVVATGEDYPDALSGGSLAATENAAMIITKKNQLPGELSPYLDPIKGNFKDSLMLGGEAALTSKLHVDLVNLLNSPITSAAAYTAVSAPADTDNNVATQAAHGAWLSTTATNRVGTLTTPLPSGYSAQQVDYRNAKVTLLENKKSAAKESFASLIINELPNSPGQSSTQRIAAWYGVDQKMIKVVEQKEHLHFLEDLPNVVPTTAAFFEKNGHLYLIESRLMDRQTDKKLIEKIYRLN